MAAGPAVPGHRDDLGVRKVILYLISGRLSQHLRGGPAICLLTDPPGDSEADGSLRTTALERMEGCAKKRSMDGDRGDW